MNKSKELENKLLELKKDNVEVYSISRLDAYKQCPQGYKYRYVEKMRKEDVAANIYAFLGSAIHDAEEEIYNNSSLNNEDCKQILRDHLNKALDYISDHNKTFEEDLHKPWDERRVKFKLKFKDETIEDNFMVSVNHYINNFEKEDKKRINELFVLINVGGKWFQGYVDAIQPDDVEKKTVHIIDYKTSTVYSKSDRLEKGRQLLLYAYAIKEIYGSEVTKVSWDMIKYLNVTFKGKTKKRKTLYLRKGWVANFMEEMKTALLEEGVEILDVPMIISDAIENNKLPVQIEKYFDITKGYVDYEITEESMSEMLKYITETPDKILGDKKFTPKKISTYDSFFCMTLCNARLVCPTLKEFKEKCRDSIVEFDEETGNIEVINFDEFFA